MERRSDGSGEFQPADLGALGDGTMIEPGVLIFNPAHVHIGQGVYVGHRTVLKGDTRGALVIGDDSWVGQNCYMHSAGGIRIGRQVGVGPGVMILTSTHREVPFPAPITDAPLEFGAVEVRDGADIGIGAILMPGTTVGAGAQIGAGAVVTRSVPDGMVAVGVPAKVVRKRGGPKAGAEIELEGEATMRAPRD
jgi:acetyltransferase-like isoleucine patch superfamily enzyme